MIANLKIQNFKPFQDCSLQLKPLTLLSGLNSTGKSSVLQVLLLLRQSYQQGLLPHKGLALNGDLVRIGIAQDALFEGSKEKSIGFDIQWQNCQKGNWHFHYNQQTDILEIDSPPAAAEIFKSSIFSDKFYYLQAERIGSRSYLEIADQQVKQHRQLGTRGEYTTHFLSLYGDEKITSPLLSHPEEQSLSLMSQVEAWMREISPGIRLKVQSNPSLNLVNLQCCYGLSDSYLTNNVGLGISYSLPIIVALLTSKPGTLIIIENPEAHLHTKAQAKIGELFALVANCGIQMIIETHSEHILNGIRLAVYAGKLPPKYLQLHYFHRREQNGQTVPEIISPRIDKNGRIDYWSAGFFDEWEKGLDVLLESVEK